MILHNIKNAGYSELFLIYVETIQSEKMVCSITLEEKDWYVGKNGVLLIEKECIIPYDL